MGATVRVAAAGLLMIIAFGANHVSAAHAAGAAHCRVWNVTRGTSGSSLAQMVRASRAGDHLAVHGVCTGRVAIRRDLVIRGLGRELPVVTGDRDHSQALLVAQHATATIRHLKIVAGSQQSAVANHGTLTLADAIVQDGNAVGIWNHPGARITVTNTVIRYNRGGNGGIMNDGVMRLNRSLVRANLSYDTGGGGGIGNWGTLSVSRSVIRGNVALGGFFEYGQGGGILNEGTLRIRASWITGNRATLGGGISTAGRLFMAGTTVTGNRATTSEDGGGRAGGLYIGRADHGHGEVSGVARLTRSTIAGNTADADGGGIANLGTLVLVASSVARNTANGSGGGIWNSPGPGPRGGSVSLLDGSSVTGNTPDDCVGTPAC